MQVFRLTMCDADFEIDWLQRIFLWLDKFSLRFSICAVKILLTACVHVWVWVRIRVCVFVCIVMWFKGIVNHAACLISSRSRFPTYLPTQWNYFFIVVSLSSASSAAAAAVADFAPQFWHILHISLAAVRVCVNTFIYVCMCVCLPVSVRPHLSMALLHLAQQQICKAFIASLSAPRSCIYICICIGVRMWL